MLFILEHAYYFMYFFPLNAIKKSLKYVIRQAGLSPKMLFS